MGCYYNLAIQTFLWSVTIRNRVPGVGFTAIALGVIGAALMQLVQGEPVAANLLANLMLSFGSAAGGVYVAKGYLV
ncbi:hypothetical protein [Acidithiobacillus ferrooxidans]|uniref:Uncharacterized protein n=2 Tax=Acidithiobacillus ferrooxidans TaxID=920 RepID=B7J517_ACIF2|nr:hypothetical protein [Acidithiobacillus ferrooxidans]ACK80473.1 hypothetical protein AFE_0495 [Acidithiobacillus ferrooxidans ATCC 23270]EGQ63550.1 hypothetical protein GGI1_20114 [Acidithiobacillus sp. GGI-221]MBN6745602.1 hypothetical protein [Acidithiobacillus sp. MC2.2]MBN6748385.1 hypothetical protein [Acidithiobacillus sp. PG05]ACH82907.1 hypothetical protein Lferr_0655 [Acidithiobacillus ferrooxidans ATCC 53993]